MKRFASFGDIDMKSATYICAVLGALLSTGRALAAVITLSATLASTPPGLSAGFGTATASVDDVTGTFSISGTFGTFRSAVQASLHGPNAPPTDFLGPQIFALTLSSSSELANEGTFTGTAILDATEIGQLISGKYLVVVETQSAPGPTASISGVLTVPEPCAIYLLGVLLLALRRPQIRSETAQARKDPAGGRNRSVRRGTLVRCGYVTPSR